VGEEDFDAFYSSAVHRLSGHLYLLTGDREEAVDCVQEAFERAWLRWDTVRHADSPEAWVRTVVRRLAVSRWRRLRNATTPWQRHAGGDEAHAAPDSGSADRVALVAALQRLPAAQRTAVVLHHLVDLDVAAVVDETGASVSAVKSQLSRGRRRLAELLGETAVGTTTTPAGRTGRWTDESARQLEGPAGGRRRVGAPVRAARTRGAAVGRAAPYAAPPGGRVGRGDGSGRRGRHGRSCAGAAAPT